ncbi:SbcC/MukB-like Walker B domain-containing protein [Uliginosibacterium sp. sgz301328]|uniref:SbcC/MukB-like Walker B domain-containing protein n=1 Tax=Uliginosibacterium sp. sgz301328 TaxID=3243764 RepID=UPI00359E3155
MIRLARVHFVEFSFWDFETFDLSPGGTAILGANGAGKTSFIDGLQVALLGAHGQHLSFNAQSVQKDHRSLRDYALGAMRSGNEQDKQILTRKRNEALTYITLVFEGDRPQDCVSAGVCMYSTVTERDHKILGLYVVPGVVLDLDDHLEDIGGGERSPMDWQQFEALLRNRAKHAGRTPTLTSKPEHYLDELLHCIQDPERHINRRQFVKALRHSINLKNVNSVGDFLRGYLVEPTPIDKHGTLAHIRVLKDLSLKIADIQQQIAQLKDINRRFETLGGHYQRRAVAQAVRLALQLESAENLVQQLLNEEGNLGRLISTNETALELKKAEVNRLRNVHLDLVQEYAKDPEAQAPQQAQALKNALSSALSQAKTALESVELDLRTCLENAREILKANASPIANRLSDVLAKFDRRVLGGPAADMQIAQSVLAILNEAAPHLHTQENHASETLRVASRKLEVAQEQLNAASRGVRLDGTARGESDVALAMALFRKAGIQSQTAASLVKVKDPSWQAAIESFLGVNRLALLVDEGKERDAVKALRHADPPLYSVSVIQPVHFRDEIGRRYASDTVASLLASDDIVALAFLQRLMGSMRCVETEAELEAHPRALTRDGMLSANGGTRRLKLIPRHEWRLGAKISEADIAVLRQDVMDATRAESAAKQLHERTRRAEEFARHCIERITLSSYGTLRETYLVATSRFDTLAAEVSLPIRLQQLSDQIAEAKKSCEEAEDDLNKLSSHVASDKQKLIQARSSLASEQKSLEEHLQNYEKARSDESHDSDAAVELYAKCTDIMASKGPEVMMQFLSEEISTAAKRIQERETLFMTEFVSYINERSIGLMDERGDWRKAAKWAASHMQLLQESTLANYEDQAAAARTAAEESFRSDVKFKMREAIKRVEQDIKELNRILDRCPEFTGGERYSFTSEVSPSYKALHDLITSDSAQPIPYSEESSDAAPISEGQAQLMRLLEACETGDDRDNNPLEDYRLLFSFDLAIKVEGKTVDTLSKRIGIASNGEHRVPFYVIAGAALASANRIRPNSVHAGCAFMLLDEAFYGMDAQNSYVTAEFLKSLGMQLIMAGPDTDVGKLVPVLDCYYDLHRNGADSHIYRVLIKDAARELLQSDIPERHPELIERAVLELS